MAVFGAPRIVCSCECCTLPPERWELVRSVPSPTVDLEPDEGNGAHLCYLGAITYALTKLWHTQTVLVHAVTKRLHYHAWCELPEYGVLYDPTANRHYPTEAYRLAAGVTDERRYTSREAARLVLSRKRPGPWDEAVTFVDAPGSRHDSAPVPGCGARARR